MSYDSTGCGYSDPHFYTFDGHYYIFHGNGHFVVLRIIDEVGNHDFELQAEMKQNPPTEGATWHKRIAFGIPGSSTFQV